MLSGFVLTWSQSARYGAGTFYRHRFARIGPLHYLTLVVAVVVVPLNVVPSLATLIQNLTFTQAWTFDGTRSFNWVSWSLSREAFFYLLFPLLIRPITALRNASLVATGILAIVAQVCLSEGERALHGPAWIMYDMPINRLGEFVLGICLAEFVRRELRVPRSVAVAVVGALPALRAGGRRLCGPHRLAEGPCLADGARPGRGGDLLLCPPRTGHPGVVAERPAAAAAGRLVVRPVHGPSARAAGLRLRVGAEGFSLPAVPATAAVVLSVGLAAVVCEFVERPLERLIAGRRIRPVAAPAPVMT